MPETKTITYKFRAALSRGGNRRLNQLCRIQRPGSHAGHKAPVYQVGVGLVNSDGISNGNGFGEVGEACTKQG